ncbi:hypothetical protein R6Q57_014149 [Mikania cordata]
MAERRRRKRLNDRLSMLRSILPRISKMDKTSILVDTINYMKELLEKISSLKEQVMESDSNSLNLIVKEAQARNQPKFEIEKRSMDTHVQICCSMKPGLLLSTVNAFEALGLDIQQCVISCFGDFTLEASCFEGTYSTKVVVDDNIVEDDDKTSGSRDELRRLDFQTAIGINPAVYHSGLVDNDEIEDETMASMLN